MSQTLSEFSANPKWIEAKDGTPAFSLVLHTWGQELQRHIHVHAVMACGVLDKAGQWATPIHKPGFLFPTPALSKVFRGKFMQALTGLATGTGATVRHKQTTGIGKGFHVSGKAGGGKAVPYAGTAPGKAQNATLRRECVVVWRVSWAVCQQIDAAVPL